MKAYTYEEDKKKTTAAPESPDTAYGGYAQKLSKLYDELAQRGEFKYDLNSDALYEQYRDSYERGGQLAMRDTVGQAAGLTGGYGSTYAESAGQQQYGEYLRQLGELIPELYGAARDEYDAEGERLSKLYSATADAADGEYSRTLKEAELMANYGDFSAYEQLYDAEKAGLMRQAWLLKNPALALSLGAIGQDEYAQLVGDGAGKGGHAFFMGDAGTAYNPYHYEDAKGKSQKEVQRIQLELGVTPDGIWGPVTEKAYKNKK